MITGELTVNYIDAHRELYGRGNKWERVVPSSVKNHDKTGHGVPLTDITPEQLRQVYADQDARCKLCGVVHHNMHADHCHLTGKFRGWLCPLCNGGIVSYFENYHLSRTFRVTPWEPIPPRWLELLDPATHDRVQNYLQNPPCIDSPEEYNKDSETTPW